MMKLPEWQKGTHTETVTVNAVRDANGNGWKQTRAPTCCCLVTASPTFTISALWAGCNMLALQNIFRITSAARWTRFSQNDAGAIASRRMLQNAGAGRLDGKKVVIWEFAERELALGNWEKLELPAIGNGLTAEPAAPAVSLTSCC